MGYLKEEFFGKSSRAMNDREKEEGELLRTVTNFRKSYDFKYIFKSQHEI